MRLSVRVTTRLRVVSAAVLAVVVFFSYFFAEIVSLRLLVVAIGALALLGELVISRLSVRRKVVVAAGGALYLGLVTAGSETLAKAFDDRLFAVNAQHLFVLLPVFAALGWTVYRTGAWRSYVPVMLVVGFIVALMSLTESILGESIVGRSYEFLISQREGGTRALVGAENSLVLGALLAALVPMTLVLRRTTFQVGGAALLIAGVWASGSRAPAVICVAVAVVQFIPLLRNLLRRFVWVVQAVAAAGVLALAWLSAFVWQPFIAGATGLDYSANYRGALYAIVADLLAERPFGYLLRSAPEGRWMVDSELHGAFDITRSLDSEVAFAAFGLGWVGIAFFLASLFLALATIRHSLVLGLAATTLTSLGFVLALHGWDGMSVLWYALIGACLSAAGRRRPMRTSRPTTDRPTSTQASPASA